MALAIATNNAALRAAASASSVNRDMETSMARLSSGKRINSASDDAAGVAISSRLTSNIRGTDQAIRNALDGQALIDTAEGAHKEIENILQRMREVAVQAANDTNNAQDRANLQAEMDALSEEVDRIAGTTTWAGTKMLDAESSDFSFHIGAGVSEQDQLKVSIGSMTSSALGLGGGTSSNNVVLGYNGSNSHPGENNTDDVKIAWGNDFGITFTLDTTGGADSIVEIAGVEYTVSAGSVGSKAASLANQISGVGHNASDQSNSAGRPDGFIGAAGEVIQDYAEAYDSFPYSFEFYGDPLDGSDGVAVDLIDGSAVPDNFAVNGTTPPSPTLDSPSNSMAAITAVDKAIQTVNIQRSKLGAVSNRLSHTVNNLTDISSNLSAAQGGIEDADFAKETTDLAKNQILQQASTAMLAQANASKQNVLSLLQG